MVSKLDVIHHNDILCSVKLNLQRMRKTMPRSFVARTKSQSYRLLTVLMLTGSTVSTNSISVVRLRLKFSAISIVFSCVLLDVVN